MSLPSPYYHDDSVTLYHGDALEIMPGLGRFDLVLTDPPYGISQDKGMGGGGGMTALEQKPSERPGSTREGGTRSAHRRRQ